MSQSDSKQPSNIETAERVLNVLDSEIENIRDTETRQGWTSWGLLGGIVGSLWLLSEELKSGTIQKPIIGTAILIFSLFTDAFRFIVFLLSPQVSRKNETIRFRWSNELFSVSRIVFIYEIVRSAALIIIGFFIAAKWWLPTTALTIAYSWYIFLMSMCLILTFKELPLREGRTTKGIIFIVIFIVSCLVSIFSYFYITPLPIGEAISTYRVSGLLVVIGYLILLLGIVTKDSPILQSLIEIRRNIAFNRLDVDSALRQAEIALSGMQIGDAIQRELNDLLVLVDRVNESTNNLIFQVQTMQTHLPTSKDSQEVVQAKTNILVGHRSVCISILRDRESAFTELNAKISRLFERRYQIESSISEAADFFNKLDSSMKVIFEDVDKKFAIYQQMANEYDKQLDAIGRTLAPKPST